jgi:hypothetical protein
VFGEIEFKLVVMPIHHPLGDIKVLSKHQLEQIILLLICTSWTSVVVNFIQLSLLWLSLPIAYGLTDSRHQDEHARAATCSHG